jgi:AcrR family transcriptional regulator
MARKPPAVKKKRPYDATARQERAQQNRDLVVAAAERRFLCDGYHQTTIAAIAADAGLSVDFVFKSFGGKPGLIRALRARALEGEGVVPAERRSDALHDHDSDPRAIIHAWGSLIAEVSPRVAPILLLIRDAAITDLEARALREDMDRARLHRMTRNARRLRDAGHLRAGVTLAHAADVLWTYSAPELYELLVLRRGWTPKRFGRFAATAMIDELLTPS